MESGRLVLGVDEFALRRGRQYGTVLVAMADGHRPVDVLLGREAGDIADWLRAHPGVQVICRDRAGGYADGARDGAPDAIQVADRWHLWDNLCQHVERLVAAHHACLPEPVVPAPEGPDRGDPVGQVVPHWPDTVRIEHTRQRYDQTHELRERGLSMRAIARKLDLNFKTVRRYLRVRGGRGSRGRGGGCYRGRDHARLRQDDPPSSIGSSLWFPRVAQRPGAARSS